MTLLVVLMIDAGLLLIISAFENISLVQTFKDIMAGKPIAIAPPPGK